VIIAAIRNVAGAFAGTAVAKWWVPDRLKQLGHQVTVISARLSAIIWDLITWHFGLPTSSSYATLSSLAGAAIATAGTGVVITKGVIKILLGLFISPITGLLLGFLLMHLLALIFRRFFPCPCNKDIQQVAGGISCLYGIQPRQ